MTLFRYYKNSTAYYGTVARALLDSRQIHASKPRFRIDGVGGFFSGELLHKVGQITGRTKGPILATCVDISIDDTLMRCQSVVGARSGGGDSGAPVFYWDEFGTDGIWLYGILWGGPEGDSSRSYVSTFEFIDLEVL